MLRRGLRRSHDDAAADGAGARSSARSSTWRPSSSKGSEADARTDIFAFGAVLYEMLTGKKAFEGKSQASLIGAILKDEPPPRLDASAADSARARSRRQDLPREGSGRPLADGAAICCAN